MPIAFRARGDISMVALIEESGYAALADDVTELVLEEHLRRHPDLVPVWVGYSEDQRSSPSFALLEPNSVSNPGTEWRVSYWDDDPANRRGHTFPDQFSACAVFIKRNADRLASYGRQR